MLFDPDIPPKTFVSDFFEFAATSLLWQLVNYADTPVETMAAVAT